MHLAIVRNAAALTLGIAGALCQCGPGAAQTLDVPVASGTRPIQTETLFHELFADFFSESDGTTYVQTGDIPAMWLRDSAAQTIPYVRFVGAYPALRAAFFGVIQRDAKNILTDPYAEAFSADYHVWERKWEIDSLAWPVLLVFVYYASTRDRTIFTPALHAAMQSIVITLSCEQRHASCSRYSWPDPVPTHGEFNPNTGLIWSAFRPSDDPVTYRFNVPQNAMAVVAMKLLARFARDAFKDDALARRATALAAQVQTGVLRYGKTFNPKYGWMYVYETDGYGHDNMMDDANIPNLTALPWYGWCANADPVYLDTRRFTLGWDDPYYYGGKYATGLGSPHTPKGWVWPLGIIGAALTATRREDIIDGIDMLDRSDTLDGLMHESVDPNDPQHFTRPEFGWANAFWADLLFRTVAGYPATPLGLLSTMV
ncbi:MAG: glycoside hydrolase family 125 protein, partial [Candidatus Eremiobacteraeota bacterium]|nr:glycoside hydrolase family 125 protein [Candidatus Eremiobacteraeota bacterium]